MKTCGRPKILGKYKYHAFRKHKRYLVPIGLFQQKYNRKNNCKYCALYQVCFRIGPIHRKSFSSRLLDNDIQIIGVCVCKRPCRLIPLPDFISCPFAFVCMSFHRYIHPHIKKEDASLPCALCHVQRRTQLQSEIHTDHIFADSITIPPEE